MRGKVVGEACGDQVTVDDARLVQHRGTGILQVDLDVPDGRGVLALEDAWR